MGLVLRRVPGPQQARFNGGDAAAADAEMKAQELRELTALGFPEQQARVRCPGLGVKGGLGRMVALGKVRNCTVQLVVRDEGRSAVGGLVAGHTHAVQTHITGAAHLPAYIEEQQCQVINTHVHYSWVVSARPLPLTALLCCRRSR